MKINSHLIEGYLWKLTMGAGASQPNPMADLEAFQPDIYGMWRKAERDGNLELLRTSIDALLSEPAGRTRQFAGQAYAFNEEEVLTLLREAYRIIWPEHTPAAPGAGPSVEFVPMTDEEWTAYSGAEPGAG